MRLRDTVKTKIVLKGILTREEVSSGNAAMRDLSEYLGAGNIK